MKICTCLLKLQKTYVHWYDSDVGKGPEIYDNYHKIYSEVVTTLGLMRIKRVSHFCQCIGHNFVPCKNNFLNLGIPSLTHCQCCKGLIYRDLNSEVSTAWLCSVLSSTRWQGWPSGESTCFPPMWPGLYFRTRHHMWIEFVGSLLCYERFSTRFSGFPLSSKTSIWFDLWILIVK